MPGPDPQRMKIAQSLMQEQGAPQSGPAPDQVATPSPNEVPIDIASFPELKDKKEGDVATISVKIKSVQGRQAIITPVDNAQDKMDKDSKSMAQPTQDGLMDKPNQGGM